ncbi:MAG: response regulator [Candidatus Zipacnadales bacterium]
MDEAARILVVDDDRGMRFTLERILQAQGYVVLSASSGAEAISIACTSPFDVGLIDYRIGDLNGGEVCRQLRAIQPQAALYVMTAYVSPEAATDACAAGAVDVIYKPVQVPELLRLLANAVRDLPVKSGARG